MRLLFDDRIPDQGGGIRISYETIVRDLEQQGHTRWKPNDPGRPDVALFSWYGVESVHQWAGRVPVVYMVDSWWHLTAVGRLPALVVFNTEYLRYNVPWREKWGDMLDRPGPYPGPAYTLHPPVLEADWHRHSVEDRYYVTLVNMSRRKGAELFWRLAALLPHRRFLGVEGSYGKQMLTADGPQLANVEVAKFRSQADLRHVFEMTDTLIVPSQESYGRVLVEATYAGVPRRLALAGPGVDETGVASLLPDLDEGKWKVAVERPPKPPLAPPDSESELAVFEGLLLELASTRSVRSVERFE